MLKRRRDIAVALVWALTLLDAYTTGDAAPYSEKRHCQMNYNESIKSPKVILTHHKIEVLY